MTPAITNVELPAARLRRRCDPDAFAFATTAEVATSAGLIGQRRALDALTFGLAMAEHGFNIYVAGPPGTGKATAVRAFVEGAAVKRPAPPDWCYVHNFRDPSRPRALRLAPGHARRLRDGLRALVRAARRDIPRAFESEEYIAGREAILGGFAKRRDEGVAGLTARAQAAGFLLQVTPTGIAIAPVMGNRPMTDEDLAGLRPEMRAAIEARREELESAVRAFLKDMRAAERAARERLEAQDREVALQAVGGVVDDLAEHYTDQPEVLAYLDELREGILADINLFRSHPLSSDGAAPEVSAEDNPEHALHERAFRKYEINVAVDNSSARGAPVVVELNPTYPNLIGRVEREVLFGALVTDVTLITPGALHRANGGYLVLRAEDLLRSPMAWEGLKRALRAGAVEIEDVNEALGLTSTRALRPDPVPLDVKVLLIGQPALYHMLYALDPDFRELFKVRADFDIQMDRTPETEGAYAAFVSACTAKSGLPLDRSGVARLIEESSRMVEDQRKLSAQFSRVADLVQEAGYWARQDGAAVIGAPHIRRAVEQRLYRGSLVQERLREMIARGVLLVKPEGAVVGQIHGLAVMGLGDAGFGQPVRITATVGAGRDGLLDIERQAELGGRIHSKGVLILAGYLADQYAQDKPLALSARLVFEQSYEEVEGDSASLAELLALLSRVADVPLRQGIAVTGSVNQRGEVQAVGGVNAKIEGFFDACAAIGLTGEQGVILPAANAEHLMLRDDVVEAAAAGRFHVYAVRSVDEALEILTGLPAGPRGADGTLPPDGIHARVDARLRGLAEALQTFAVPVANGHDGARPAATGVVKVGDETGPRHGQ